MAKKERLLILCVDRDNDIGSKTGIKGPVMGKEESIKAAVKLSLKDPEDSDSNAIFGAVKLFEELKESYNAEIAVITGHKSRGIESDREISSQLGKTLKKHPSDYTIFVSDGSDDEYVTPIIQSQIPILSVKRVIVRQSEQLESGYYKIKDFLKESMENPKVSRLVFGLPAIALILLAFFGSDAWRLIIGVLGAYFFIKGFRLEEYVYRVFEEFRSSMSKRRFAFFVYIIAIVIVFFAFYRGYTAMTDFWSIGMFESIAAFLFASVYFFWIAGMIAWLGHSLSLKRRTAARIASVPLFGLSVAIVLYNASDLILNPDISSFNFIVSIVIGFFIAFLALMIEAMGKKSK